LLFYKSFFFLLKLSSFQSFLFFLSSFHSNNIEKLIFYLGVYFLPIQFVFDKVEADEMVDEVESLGSD